MSYIRVILTHFLVTIFISSCSGEVLTTTPAYLPTQTPAPATPTFHLSIPSETLFHAKTPTPTITPLPPTATSTQSMPAEVMKYRCLDIQQSIPDQLMAKGRIAMHGYGEQQQSLLFDPETGEKYSLNLAEGEHAYEMSVSPDGIWLAYLTSTFPEPGKERLEVITADGQVNLSTTWEGDWHQIAGWLDNTRLMINKRGSTPYPYQLDTLILLDIISDERVELQPSFPRINWIDFVSWNYSRTVYDLTLTRVVYPSLEGDPNSIVLWDVPNNIALASVPAAIHISPEPQWSPDGKQVVVTGWTTYITSTEYIGRDYNQELFSITREGKINRLTFLTERYTNVVVGPYSWSPDGKYITFWLYTVPAEPEGERLAVLDTVTGEVTNYCIPGTDLGWPDAPMWSPYALQMVVESAYDYYGNRQVILVDIEKGIAVQIAENLTPVGWMVEP